MIYRDTLKSLGHPLSEVHCQSTRNGCVASPSLFASRPLLVSSVTFIAIGWHEVDMYLFQIYILFLNESTHHCKIFKAFSQHQTAVASCWTNMNLLRKKTAEDSKSYSSVISSNKLCARIVLKKLFLFFFRRTGKRPKKKLSVRTKNTFSNLFLFLSRE